MRRKLTGKDKVFNVFNYGVFGLLTLICAYPFYYLIINTLSANDLSAAGVLSGYQPDRAAYGERNGRVHSLELRSMHPLSGTWLAVSIQNAGRWRHQAFLCYGKRTGTGDNS